MDDKRNRGTADRLRVNTHEDYEVRYWSEKFKVSPEKLKETVKDVGVMAKDVEKALRK